MLSSPRDSLTTRSDSGRTLLWDRFLQVDARETFWGRQLGNNDPAYTSLIDTPEIGGPSDRPSDLLEMSGRIKWFDVSKGYGFIVPDTGGDDVFVHITGVERSGMTGLTEGQKVDF